MVYKPLVLITQLTLPQSPRQPSVGLLPHLTDKNDVQSLRLSLRPDS